MEVTVLSVPGCPNAGVFQDRLSSALAGVVVHRRVVDGEQEAAAAGMHGSPTLLIDGVDPFAMPNRPPSLSCRLYRDPAGRSGGIPTIAELRQVLAEAGHD
jgi:hypothetical protein